MKNLLITKVILNLLAVMILAALLASPVYFAVNLGKVAGVKSQSNYLLVSQIENFPNLSFSQQVDTYNVSLTKFGPKQAYLGVFILNNPTNDTQSYKVEKLSGEARVFFGQQPSDPKTSVTLPSQSSVKMSLISEGESTNKADTVEFKIQSN